MKTTFETWQKYLWVKTRFYDPIKKWSNITAKLLTLDYKPRVMNFKLDEDLLHHRVYFLSFMNSLPILFSPISELYMLLMDYPSTRGEELPYYSKKSTWDLLYAYIDSHSKILVDECPGNGVQDISRFKYQCANMTFAEKNRYNRMFQ